MHWIAHCPWCSLMPNITKLNDHKAESGLFLFVFFLFAFSFFILFFPDLMEGRSRAAIGGARRQIWIIDHKSDIQFCFLFFFFLFFPPVSWKLDRTLVLVPPDATLSNMLQIGAEVVCVSVDIHKSQLSLTNILHQTISQLTFEKFPVLALACCVKNSQMSAL